MDKQYCTVNDVSAYSLLNIDPSFAGTVEDWIVAMSNFVALQTNREWLADTTATARVFNGNGYATMQFDDFIDITLLEIGDDFLDDMETISTYTTYPYNTAQKNTIILKDNIFPSGIQNVRVTAKWGYSVTVPKDIAFAVTVLVTGIIQAQTNQEGEIESERIGNYTVKYTTEQQKRDFVSAMDIIKSRRLIRL